MSPTHVSSVGYPWSERVPLCPRGAAGVVAAVLMCSVHEVCNATGRFVIHSREKDRPDNSFQCPNMAVLYAHIITVSANGVINL